MKTVKVICALLALLPAFSGLRAQSAGIISISSSATATTADYEKVVAAMKEKGAWEKDWTFHAIGTAQPTGLYGFGLFPDRDAFNRRLEIIRPIFEQAGAKPEMHDYEVYNSFLGNVPATAPAGAILVRFDARGMTTAQYDQIIVELKKVITFPPPGQISHVAYKTDEGLKVIDVWDSAESFAAMGEKLMPILQNLGINTGAPITYNLYNLLKTNN